SAGRVVTYDRNVGRLVATGAFINLPAVLAVAAVTVVLVVGIRESARVNTTMVVIKLAAVAFVIGVGALFVRAANWHPFAPFGWTGLALFGRVVAGQSDAGGQPLGIL